MAKILEVSPATLKEWLAHNQVVLIDVREPAEHQSLSIEGATLMPLSQLKMDKNVFPKHEGKRLVLHCASGRRSMMVCEELVKQEITEDIWNLAGGVNEWVAQGLPVKRAAKRSCLPLEQQIQLTLGILLIMSTTLSFFVNQYWLILPLLIGIGLVNTGITGWCGLGKILAKMPWNQAACK